MGLSSLCLKGIEKIENFLSYCGLLGITYLTFIMVLNRYFIHYEIIWLGDFTQYLFVFMSLCAITFTTREDAHTSVDILSQIFLSDKPKAKCVYKGTIHILTLITLFYFLVPMTNFALRAIKHPAYGTMVPWFNTSWLIISCFIMLILCIFHTSVNFMKQFFFYISIDSSKKEEI